MQTHAAEFSVHKMAEVLQVSVSGYYAWRGQPASAWTQANHALVEQIQSIHQASRQSYSSPRIHAELAATGHTASKNRVAKLMKMHEIRAARRPKRKKPPRVTTPTRWPPTCSTGSSRPSGPTKNGGDITYSWTAEGWLYLAVVLDLFSRRIVGWAMADTLESDLVERAFAMAVQRRKPHAALLHHSDRGSQYAAHPYRQLLENYPVTGSMSRRGNCYDNAPMESFFSSLKCEQVHRQRYQTRAEARNDIFSYIEVFYNRKRRHSSLGYVSPEEFELQLQPLA